MHAGQIAALLARAGEQRQCFGITRGGCQTALAQGFCTGSITRRQLLAGLRQQGPVYVHCVAAMERSPLVCLAWLVSRHGQTPERALDYVMEVHPGTNPLPGQLALLGQLGSIQPGPLA